MLTQKLPEGAFAVLNFSTGEFVQLPCVLDLPDGAGFVALIEGKVHVVEQGEEILHALGVSTDEAHWVHMPVGCEGLREQMQNMYEPYLT